MLSSPALAAVSPNTQADAESAFVAARFADADRGYAQILAQASRTTLALIRRGQVALFSNRLADAKALIERARAEGAAPVRVSALLGEIAYRQDAYATAAGFFRVSGHEAKAHKLETFGAFPPTLERSIGYRINGIIPHAFLRAWSVTLDFDRMQVALDRPQKP